MESGGASPTRIDENCGEFLYVLAIGQRKTGGATAPPARFFSRESTSVGGLHPPVVSIHVPAMPARAVRPVHPVVAPVPAGTARPAAAVHAPAARHHPLVHQLDPRALHGV